MAHDELHTHDGTKAVSRRGALRVGAGVVGGAVVSTVAGAAQPADAAAGQALVLGTSNTAGTAETQIHSTAAGDHGTFIVYNDTTSAPGNGNLPDALRVFAVGAGLGAAIEAYGGPNTFSAVQQPDQGIGVRSIGTLRGVYAKAVGPARAATVVAGVEAVGVDYGVLASSTGGTGVYASTSSGSASTPAVHGIANAGPGVLGDSTTGPGVEGRGSGAGTVGVLGTTNSGGTAVVASSFVSSGSDGSYGLDVVGRARFSSAGRSTIAAGNSQLKVFPGVAITPQTIVLATLQGNGGTLKFAKPNPADDSILVKLTANATAPVVVGWFVIG
jgi:hypothetical protein